MNQTLFALLLVLVLESHGILVVDEPYVPRTSINLTLHENKTPNNFTKNEATLEKLPTESTTYSKHEDQDSNESSGSVAENKVQRSSEDEEEELDSEEEPEGPPDHVIPYSEHEEPRNVSTKPNYVGPGEWAKPPKNSDVPLDFVPTKLYAQVRKTHTVRRLPRRKAIENAESEEEKKNAARLREVVRNSKVNTVYTEEGYEDSAYDHGGHIRDADYQEDYARKLREQLHDRKKAEDDEDDDERDATERKKYTKIDPEEFKDYEDYDDHHTDSNVVNGRKEAYPKVVAQNGIKRLQEDVEREVEDIEKGFETGKLDKDQSSIHEETSKESGEQRKKIKKRRRLVLPKESKINHKENLAESKSVENHSTTMVPIETTTLKKNFVNPSDSYQYETHENSPYINFQQAEDNPTTVSYSKLFWDYFKTKEIEPTTNPPSTLTESTTISPNFLQASSILGNVNTLAPYSLYDEETTTLFPIVESAIFGARTFAPSQFLIDPEYIKSNNQNNQLPDLKETNAGDFWRPIIPNEPVTIMDTQLLGTYDGKILNDDQGIPFSNPVKNLDSKEDSDRNLDSSLFNPSLNLLTNRKPRYKIAVRQKPKKVTDYVVQKSEPQIERATPKSILYNENYMKVLMHLKNEEKAKNRHPNGIQPNNFYPSANTNNPDDLRRMRPPLPQNPSDYTNFYSRRQTDNTRAGSQKSRQVRKDHQPRQNRLNSSRTVQRSSTRNRNLIPSIDLLPPTSRLIDDFGRSKETVDYLTGNGSNQARNLLRPFQRTGPIEPIAGIRAKRRERRSTNDGNGGDVKGSRLPANNDATNRYEIERAAKNSSIERNSLLRANSGVQVELVPDTSAEKRNDEKKSRSAEWKGSFQEGRAVERESHTDMNETKPLTYNNDEWKRKDIVDEEESSRKKNNHEDLLNESPKITNDVIQKEIDARFNGKEEEEDEQEDIEDDVEVEIPDFDYVEEIPEENNTDNEETTEPSMNLEKYPFYNNERIPTPSALRYAIDPQRLPRKTYGGMEFYGSRDSYKHCEEVEPTLKVLPEKEEPVPERGPEENLPRLRGLGDKLDCFKAKYFDNNPFDNPLFLEKDIGDPSPPAELDTKRFASRIMMFPKQSDDYVIQKSSRKPENYRRPRKPSSSPVRIQKSRRILYRTIPGSGRGKRPRVYRAKGVRVKYAKDSRRPQKVIIRPITSASDVWSLYTPYQSQVYEDVMGTIRNMANSYQVHEVTTVPTSDEVTVAGEMIDDIKVNVSGNSTVYHRKEKDNDAINIVERPRKVDANIEGLIPPKHYNRHQSGYNRNRIPQRNKTRVQHWRISPNGVRVNHRPKLRVYKRSAEEFSSIEKKMISNSEERDDKQTSNRFLNKTTSVVKNNADYLGKRNSTASDAASRSIDAKRKFKVPKSVSNDNGDEKKDKPQKIIYTINDRIRYSKPKGDITRVGKFVNKTEEEEDKRRREPRYNYIKRRRPLNSTSSTTETPSLDSTDQINWTESSISTAKLINEDTEQSNKGPAKENEEIHFPLEDIKNRDLDTSTKLEEQDQIARSNKQPLNKTKNGYAVYEKVNEHEETTTQEPHPETSSEFFNLKTFLETDPPGYTEMSSEEFKKSFPNNNSSGDFKYDPESTNAKETGNKESDDEDNASFEHRSEEESSEKMDIQPSTESSEESDSKESNSEEHSTFFKYETRPSSPAENYEDEKYAELGPRINKPAFFHPPFSFSRSSRSKGSSEEVEDSEEKEEYVFPWYKDKQNERKKRRYRGKIGEYEYPWERRERLAREERRKRKGPRGSFHDDEDAEDTVLNHRKIYPRGKYRFWSRTDKDASEENVSDAIGSSSEQRPVRKYSSKYSAKSTKLPIGKKKIKAKSRSLEEISRSITKALEGDSEEKKKDSYKNRGITRGIVPEDVTLEPITRNKKKMKNSTVDNADIEMKHTTDPSENNSDDSQVQTTILKATAEAKSSIERANKKRRRPVKNAIANVENTLKSVDDSNRARRRQKSGSTTPATTTSSSTVSTTSASRVVRRRNQKSVKDSKRLGKDVNRSNNGVNNGTDTSKSGALGHRSNAVNGKTDGKKSSTKETSDRLDKNAKRPETLAENPDEIKDLNKSTSEQGGNLENVNMNKKSDIGDPKKINETSKLNEKFHSVDTGEEFDFRDDRIESLSDFDKSDDSSDEEFGSVLKTDAGFTPKNRAVQLSEQESREVVSSVSWISENYHF